MEDQRIEIFIGREDYTAVGEPENLIELPDPTFGFIYANLLRRKSRRAVKDPFSEWGFYGREIQMANGVVQCGRLRVGPFHPEAIRLISEKSKMLKLAKEAGLFE